MSQHILYPRLVNLRLVDDYFFENVPPAEELCSCDNYSMPIWLLTTHVALASNQLYCQVRWKTGKQKYIKTFLHCAVLELAELKF
jgi:hypothetical protein